jgi:3-deoxy-D-manno-octulosonate 8-phosphate phosphatase (KDO 8-P phosphatase)
MEDFPAIEERASHIQLLLMDCDGVLTDGRLLLLENGDEQKTFNVRDGLGITLLHHAGLKSGIISGRKSDAVQRRAKELEIQYVRQGSLHKLRDFDELLTQAAVQNSEVAFIGDDITDIPLMRRSGLAVAVADAVEEALLVAHYVTRARGGFGAVREVVELILKSQSRWADLVRPYAK